MFCRMRRFADISGILGLTLVLEPFIVWIHRLPIGDEHTGHTGFEKIRKPEHGANCGPAAVRSSPNADAIRIQPRESLCELLDRGDMVFEIHRIDPPVSCPTELARAVRGASCIDTDHGKAAAIQASGLP